MMTGLRVEQFLDRIIPDLIHADAYFESDLGEIRGSGSAYSKERAIFIACQELRERYKYRQLGASNSNGFASGLSQEDAKARAEFELIERDAFMRSWQSTTSPFWHKESIERINEFRKFDFDLRIGTLAKYDHCTAMIMALLPYGNRRNFGFSIATAAGIDVNQLKASMLTNCARLANVVLRREELGLTMDFKIEKICEPHHHYEHYMDPKNNKAIDWFWESSSKIEQRRMPNFESQVFICQLPFPWDASVAYAKSRDTLPIHFGQSTATLLHPLG